MNKLEEFAEKTKRERQYIYEVRLGRFGSSNVTNVPTSGKFGPKPSGSRKIFEPHSTGIKGFSQELATAAFHTAFPGLVPLHRLIVKHFLSKKPQPKSTNVNANNATPTNSGPHPMTQMMSMASSQGVTHPMTQKMSSFPNPNPPLKNNKISTNGPKASTDTSALIQKLVNKLPSSNGPIPSMFNLNQKPKPHFKIGVNGSMESSNPRKP